MAIGEWNDQLPFLLFQLHAPAAVESAAGPGAVQGPGVESAQEVPSNRTGRRWQLATAVVIRPRSFRPYITHRITITTIVIAIFIHVT